MRTCDGNRDRNNRFGNMATVYRYPDRVRHAIVHRAILATLLIAVMVAAVLAFSRPIVLQVPTTDLTEQARLELQQLLGH